MATAKAHVAHVFLMVLKLSFQYGEYKWYDCYMSFGTFLLVIMVQS